MVCWHNEYQRERCNHVERNEAVTRMISEIGEDCGGDRHLSGGANQHGVSVGRLLRGKLGGDTAPRSNSVLDDRRRSGIFLELLHDEPREQIVTATGGKPNDEMNYPVRIVGLGAPVSSRKCHKQGCKCADESVSSFRHYHIPPLAHHPHRLRVQKAYTGSGHSKMPFRLCYRLLINSPARD